LCKKLLLLGRDSADWKIIHPLLVALPRGRFVKIMDIKIIHLTIEDTENTDEIAS